MLNYDECVSYLRAILEGVASYSVAEDEEGTHLTLECDTGLRPSLGQTLSTLKAFIEDEGLSTDADDDIGETLVFEDKDGTLILVTYVPMGDRIELTFQELPDFRENII